MYVLLASQNVADAAVRSASACVTAFSFAVTCACALSTLLISPEQPASATTATVTQTAAADRIPRVVTEFIFTAVSDHEPNRQSVLSYPRIRHGSARSDIALRYRAVRARLSPGRSDLSTRTRLGHPQSVRRSHRALLARVSQDSIASMIFSSPSFTALTIAS